MNFFKSKRPHSPDSIGIQNYKRRRLVEDFASLSLSSERRPSVESTSNVTNILSGDILVPTSTTVKKKLLDISHKEHSNKSNAEVIYGRILEWIKEDTFQLTKWVDWKHVVYMLWYNWYQKDTTDIEMDDQTQDTTLTTDTQYNIITNENNYVESNLIVDTDVDMDA